MESWDGGLRPGRGQGEAGDRPPWHSTTVGTLRRQLSLFGSEPLQGTQQAKKSRC